MAKPAKGLNKGKGGKVGGVGIAKKEEAPDTVQPQAENPPVEMETVTYLYPQLEVFECSCEALERGGHGAITAEKAKELLGWETEDSYLARMKAADPTIQAEACKFGEDYSVIDQDGAKVKMWYNANNRPFNQDWAKQLAQDILNRNWAGPTTMAGETVNGETIVIGRDGQVISGQHRLAAIILANQRWLTNQARWLENWPTPPVLETIIVLGVSTSSKVLRTVDNVRARTLADVLYTSDVFKGLNEKDRRECARMLQVSITTLWTRLRIGEDGSNGYQTHSEALGFLERHTTLLKAIGHIYNENKGRALSVLRLSPGQCAACMYLMGTSDSDIDTYRTSEVRNEKSLDFSRWDQAASFFSNLVMPVDKSEPWVRTVRETIGALVDADSGTGGRAIERLGVITKAWNAYKDGITEMVPDDLTITYYQDDAVLKIDFSDYPTFDGIDRGPREIDEKKPDRAAPTQKEIEEEKARIRQEHLDKLKDNRKTLGEKAGSKAQVPFKPFLPKGPSTPVS